MSKSRDRRRRWQRRQAQGMNDRHVRVLFHLGRAATRAARSFERLSRSLPPAPAYHYEVTRDGRVIERPTPEELEALR